MAALMAPPSAEAPRIEWAVASAALDGQASGDLHVVCHDEHRSLLGVIDGLGHGPEARRAARECAATLETFADAPLLNLVGYCHEALRGTRGVALTLCRVERARGDLEWLSIGNVEGLVLREGSPRKRAHAAVLQRGGVLGYRLPPLESRHVALADGDLIVLATDGIEAGFAAAVDPLLDVQVLADFVLGNYARTSDDRLVLVARYAERAAP
jgi:negative regulator of sigma-B (phosphoserine phosphatase)